MGKTFVATAVSRFNMLWFIMALGLGGTSVAGFAFLNYTFQRPAGFKGLVHPEVIEANLAAQGAFWSTVYELLRVHISVFGALHLAVLLFTFGLFFLWRRNYPEKYQELLADNTRNAVVIAPALAVGMTFNVLLVGGYFNMPWMRENMQSLMPYALGGWLAIFVYTMATALRIQKRHLEHGFDVHKMHFGWLLIPFALGMTAVSGAGVAALAKDPTVASTAFFLSLVPFTMASFLLLVKVISIFRSQYLKGLPQKIEFLPSFFIVIPIFTLLAITVFRFGHYFDHQFAGHLPKAFFASVTASAWAFELWYLALGLALLGGYLKKHLFSMRYFDESQWGLICPMVALAVLGSFVYATLLPSPLVMAAVLGFIVLDVAVLSWIALRQYRALLARAREAADEEAALASASPRLQRESV